MKDCLKKIIAEGLDQAEEEGKEEEETLNRMKEPHGPPGAEPDASLAGRIEEVASDRGMSEGPAKKAEVSQEKEKDGSKEETFDFGGGDFVKVRDDPREKWRPGRATAAGSATECEVMVKGWDRSFLFDEAIRATAADYQSYETEDEGEEAEENPQDPDPADHEGPFRSVMGVGP